jgi:hypothetical protein
MKPTCFVIQPFDGNVYDARYRDTFKPAIIEAGFEPYRVDHDPSVSVPIEKIEQGIIEADCVFAEITEDNANVWLEVGLAIAHSQSLCLVCSDKRTKFPFDVQHRAIIKYESSTRSDFDQLKAKIVSRLKAIDASDKQSKSIRSVVVRDSATLKLEEINCLAAVAGNVEGYYEIHGLYRIMSKWNFTNIGTTIAVRSLNRRDFVSIDEENNHDGDVLRVVKITDRGWSYIEENTDKFIIKRPEDDIPF